MGIGEGIAVNERTERWLEEADEFGVMFMTIGKFLFPFFLSLLVMV